MQDVFILGAGFSKAISEAMPTMANLSVEVIGRLKMRANQDEAPFHIQGTLLEFGNDIELWMTYLSQQQPWLSEEDYHRNLALTRDIRKLIREFIVSYKGCSMKKSPPDWLNTLIKLWHLQKASVITLNYDTLVESACRELQTETSKCILPGQMYPPYFANIASRSGVGVWNESNLDTFTYFKLHGSTNWYYSGRDEFHGETIFYSDILPWEYQWSRAERNFPPQARDKECLIIPPVTDKLTYFNNETVRRLWREASEALRSATRVFIIGYSLPPSDIGMKFFLQHSQPSKETEASVYIIDRDDSVVKRYKKLLPKHKKNVISKFTGENAVSDFVKWYSGIVKTQ